jgi:hypothetical protein
VQGSAFRGIFAAMIGLVQVYGVAPIATTCRELPACETLSRPPDSQITLIEALQTKQICALERRLRAAQ